MNPIIALDADGPVVCIRAFSTEDEAIQLANDSRLGLTEAVMSDDDERCERVAAKLRAGGVWINCSQPTFSEAPWGGQSSEAKMVSLHVLLSCEVVIYGHNVPLLSA